MNLDGILGKTKVIDILVAAGKFEHGLSYVTKLIFLGMIIMLLYMRLALILGEACWSITG